MSASGHNGSRNREDPGSVGGNGGRSGNGMKPGQVRGYRGRPDRKAKAVDSLRGCADRLFHLTDGSVIVLRMPQDKGGVHPGKRRPRYWSSLSFALSGGGAVPEKRLNGWLLVLEAKKIPHVFFPGGNHPSLYVPALYEGVALHEILAFERERPVPVFVPPARDNALGVLFFLALLIVWHGLRWGWFHFQLPSPPFPPTAEGWSGSFGLDVYKARVLHEWWRAVTALSLHADDAHLLSNVVFGLFLFIPLCRRAGLGLGVALALVAGIAGNVCNALTRNDYVISLGFSTALFGAVGSLCALSASDIIGHYLRFAHMHGAAGSSGCSSGAGLAFAFVRRMAVPLAAGMALLGILGGGGEIRTDYAAHIWGFCCGVVCTLAALPGERTVFKRDAVRQAALQTMLFLSSLGLMAGVWCYALFLR